MALLNIYNCFHPVLKKKTESITEIDDNLKKFAQDMFDTMYRADGSGLAANQVGVEKSIIVIDASYYKETNKEYKPLVLINPEIISSSDEESDFKEGCLSVPTMYEIVKRPKAVQVQFYDLNGKENIIEDDDFLARVMQHEIDHLNGILFYERLSALRRTLSKKLLNKIRRGDIIPDYPMIGSDGILYEIEDT